MRRKKLRTKIFLDGGDPDETVRVRDALGFLDGQTTNPTLVAKNPEVRERIARGEKFSSGEILAIYKKIVEKISHAIPDGSVSIEVYADAATSAETMGAQATEMFGWIPNAHIKFPIIASGLAAAEVAVARGMRMNMTLCFSLAQAAAVYAATKGAERGSVFISPFIGRLDDTGVDGISLVQRIVALYRSSDHHVSVLAASVRNTEHLFASLACGADIVTAPAAVLLAWHERGCPIPDATFVYDRARRTAIDEKIPDLTLPWDAYGISHPLTDQGLLRFANDWNALCVS